MTTAKKKTTTEKTTTNIDPGKRYAVSMGRVVEHEGFVYKPGPELEMAGDLVEAIAQTYGAAAIAEARELPPAPDHPDAPEAVHESADQTAD